MVDCAATLDFVFDDFVRRFTSHSHRSPTKTLVRLANGQRVTSSTVCDVTFELARLEFQRTLYVSHDLRPADLVQALPWLDEEQASLQFGTTRVFTLMDGTLWKLKLRRAVLSVYRCRLLIFRKLMRKTRRSRGRNTDFYVIEVTLEATQPNERGVLQNNVKYSGRYSTMTSRSYCNKLIRRL
jgi:hypothetical protein